MSLQKRFRSQENRDAALVKVWFVWADSDVPVTRFSRPEFDRRGLDEAVRRTIAYFNRTIGEKIKDRKIRVYDNQTKALIGVFVGSEKLTG